MGRGKKISLDTAGHLLTQLKEVKPVRRGHYASVAAFVSQHHGEFLEALERGVTHEQIADLMLEHDITVSPTTLRRYLPKQPHVCETTATPQLEEKAEIGEADELTMERQVCVVIAAMHVLQEESWQTFQQLCELIEIQVEYFDREDDEIDEVSFTRSGEVFKKMVDRTFVTLGDHQLTWEQIDPDAPERSRMLYEVLQQNAPELLPKVRQLETQFQQS